MMRPINPFSLTYLLIAQRRGVSGFIITRHYTTFSARSQKVTGRTASKTNSKNRLFDEELNILYDSKCNVCRWEIDFLRRRDERLNGSSKRRLKFTDIEEKDPLSDPANGGVDYRRALSSMHAVTADGKVLQGVEVFRAAYEKVGMGWLWTVATKFPMTQWIADRLYAIFARYRTHLTRNASIDELVELYEQKKQEQVKCNDGKCQTISGKSQDRKRT